MTEVTVRFYSGPRGETCPRALLVNARELPVTEIVDRGIVEDFATRRRERRFLCVADAELWEITCRDEGTVSCRRVEGSR